MSKFLFLYRGPATPMEDITPESGAELTAAWEAWSQSAGAALVDFGAPFGARTAVADDGTSRATSDQNGYSIVEADSLAAATALTEKHPFLTEGKGRFAIEVFELVPM
jgi:hypothetical protein